MIVFDDEIQKAIQRIALTEDGQILRIGLQRACMALAPSADPGALPVFEGGRRFASKLIEVMDSSIAEQISDGAGSTTLERPIVIVARSAARVGVPGGARRRVPADPSSDQ